MDTAEAATETERRAQDRDQVENLIEAQRRLQSLRSFLDGVRQARAPAAADEPQWWVTARKELLDVGILLHGSWLHVAERLNVKVAEDEIAPK